MSNPHVQIYHPRAGIAPTREAMERVLKAGWIAQIKYNGVRCQVHKTSEGMHYLNRQGKQHSTVEMHPEILKKLTSVMGIGDGFAGEWLRIRQIYVIWDVVRKDGRPLDFLSYEERMGYAKIGARQPRVLVVENITGIDECVRMIEETDDTVEGLIFRSPKTKGFPDSSIVRCRKSKFNDTSNVMKQRDK